MAIGRTHADATEGAAVGIGGDYGAAKALIAHNGRDRRVGHERFLQPLAAFGFFDEDEAVLKRGLVGDCLGGEWGVEFRGEVAVDQGGPELRPPIRCAEQRVEFILQARPQ